MTKYSDKASAIKNKLDAKYNKATYSQTVASNAEGAYEIGKITVDGTQTTIYGQNTQGSTSPGTFTDLQALITNATAPNGQIPIIILNKDYKYDSTTDSSLTSGITTSKDITIIGNGHVIDGNNSKRTFYINGQYTINLYDLRIQNCSGNYGGAIYANTGAMVNINNTTFNQNNATTSGGAIYANSATVNINNTQFTNNIADTRGGAINTWSDATININNTTFNQHTATDYGGAIYANSSATVTMKNSSFQNNTASNYVNIYSYNAITIYKCTIPNIATSCYNVTNITIESLVNMIGDAITYINGTGSGN